MTFEQLDWLRGWLLVAFGISCLLLFLAWITSLENGTKRWPNMLIGIISSITAAICISVHFVVYSSIYTDKSGAPDFPITIVLALFFGFISFRHLRYAKEKPHVKDDKHRSAHQQSYKERDRSHFNEQRKQEPFIKPEPNSLDRHYANILGIGNDQSPKNIKIKYRELIAKYHPDKVAHLGDEFQEIASKKTLEINEAYAFFKAKQHHR